MSGHLPGLDALRGLAVLVVFVSHAANHGMLPRFLGNGFGQMGVQLFFVLSGYLMMRLYGGKAFSGTAVRRFAVGRAARISPLYALILGVSALWAWVGWHPPYQFSGSAEWLQAVLFISAPQELWSIPVEVQFYGLFVGIWLLVPHLGAMMLWLLPVSLLLAFGWRGWISEASVIVPYLPAFVLGVVICRNEGRLAGVIRVLAQPYFGLLCLALFLANMPGLRGLLDLELTERFYPRMWLDPLRLAVVALLFLSALRGTGLWRWPLGLQRLGQLSFCVYLVHRPILQMIDLLDLPGAFAATLGLIASILIAEASLRFIEHPAQRALKARFAAPMRPAPQPA
ncbi:acyltransferase family protein [Halovulum sp. GXIMD14793]